LTKWSLSIIIQLCGNNRHFSVCVQFAINRRSLPRIILGGQCKMVDFAWSNVLRALHRR